MTRELHFQHEGSTLTATVTPQEDGWLVLVGERRHEVQAQAAERGRLALAIDGQRVFAYVARQGSRVQVHVGGQVWELERSGGAPRRRAGEAAGASGLLAAAMPGRVLDVLVKPGDSVRKGETLVLLEAMKMELRIAAPADGAVLRVHVAPGQIIERAAPLVELL